jgi:predicted extracellular nuclease
MYKTRILSIIGLLLVLCVAVQAQESYKLAFYNVENLFDIEDAPVKLDEDFTPEGKQKWDAKRYQDKLNKIAEVLDSLDKPHFIGFAEVENKKVLEDLINTPNLKSEKYGIVHAESPDMRGIDVAFLYKTKHMKVLETDFIRVNFPDHIEKGYTSRDIVYVKGKLSNGDILHVFVNHWPSRRGGLEKSEPKRLFVAQHVRAAVDDIFEKDPEAKIVLMGDFNDETDNVSITSVLGALPDSSAALNGLLYNCFSSFDKEKKGTYNYRGNWNMLDQFIVSGALKNPQSSLMIKYPTICDFNWLMYEGKNGKTPSRTYGGPNYYGGYSDHLPITIELQGRK